MTNHHRSSSGPALPPQSVAPVISSFDGSRVNFLQHLGPSSAFPPTLIRFPTDQRPSGPSGSQLEDYPGLYNSQMVCKRGVMGVNNQCICPGSRDQMPFENLTPEAVTYKTRILFSPFVKNGVPPLTPAAQKLVAQRSQMPRGVGARFGFDDPVPRCY